MTCKPQDVGQKPSLADLCGSRVCANVVRATPSLGKSMLEVIRDLAMTM